MKKKCAAAIVLAAALAVQPMWAFASSSSSSSGSDGSGSITSSTTNTSKNSNTTVTVSSTGVKTTGATTSASPTGSTIGVAVDTVTTTGQQVTTNSKGQAVIGDTAVGFASSVAATAGLPENVVSAINEINAGKPLAEAVQTLDLTGYNALTGTHAIITMDANTGAVKTGAVEVSLYVPNLVENLANVQVLFYDNATGQWQLIPAVKVDPVTKTVAVNVPGSGTLSVVYKNQ
ncbi:hypothetical protein LK536_08460 [Lachnoclostridium pacaense]|uniref:hypothetical protein n=1 Tax=Enterocloster hominis (ex Hitch et al. 2024) TaxID=1917870 RepID=UPI001D11D1DD|nr:hypothetical protein [Lachnoclostridium pacaense]MCC2876305.1 hypothetical protein [Lachnoclostridium pacaense]